MDDRQKFIEPRPLVNGPEEWQLTAGERAGGREVFERRLIAFILESADLSAQDGREVVFGLSNKFGDVTISIKKADASKGKATFFL